MKDLFLILMAVITIFSLSSCKKENKSENTLNSNKNPNYKSGGGTTYYKNPLNPQDTLGQMHNDIVDYVLNYADTFGTPVHEDALLLTKLYLQGFGSSTDLIIQNAFEVDSTELYNALALNSDNVDLAYNTTVNNFSSNPNARIYLQSLYDAVMEYEDSTNILPLMDSIRNIEAVFALDMTITSDEKDQLYSVASVLRHSMHYWYNNYYTLTMPPNWTGGEPDGALFKKIGEWFAAKWPKIKNIVRADAKGFTSGTGTIGVVFPAVKVYAGLAVGAVSSVVTAIEDNP